MRVLAVALGGEDRAADKSSLRLQVLGPLRLWRDGVELDAGPRQQAYLLALLLARTGRPTSSRKTVRSSVPGAARRSAA